MSLRARACVPHECWIKRACCQLLGGASVIHLEGQRSAWGRKLQLRFWPSPTSMHSFTVFLWWAGLGLQELGGLQCCWNLLVSRGNVICTYECIVPPAWTGPRLLVSEEQLHSFSVWGSGWAAWNGWDKFIRPRRNKKLLASLLNIISSFRQQWAVCLCLGSVSLQVFLPSVKSTGGLLTL